MLPAKVQRRWLVDPNGTAIEQKPPPKPLTSGQRHYMYRLGLQAVDKFLKAQGFRSNSSDSTSVFSYEKRQVWIDLKLTPPDNIAYVTSHVGYDYGRTKASVVTAKDIMGSDMLIQIMVSTQDDMGTRTPVFVPLPKDLEKPAQHVMRQVLGMLSLACESIPKMREAFTEEAVKAAQEQAIEIESIPEHLLE